MLKKILLLLFVTCTQLLCAQSGLYLKTIAGDSLQSYRGHPLDTALRAGMNPVAIAIDDSNNIFIVDQINNLIRKIFKKHPTDPDTAYWVETYAGNFADSLTNFAGDGGNADSAVLWYPTAITLDKDSQNLYIVDNGNNRIRKVTKANANNGFINTITTVVGNGTLGFTGDGGPALAASLNDPMGVAIDTARNIYIADGGNNCIRKVIASTGTITTIAGSNTGIPGYTGDGGPAVDAQLYDPTAVTLDAAGNIYIADYGNNVVREINAVTGFISTIAGNGVDSYYGNGDSLATHAAFGDIEDIKVDQNGNIFIADQGSGRVREVTPVNGKVYTIAGGGAKYFNDTVPLASEMSPFGIALGPNSNLFIADGGFNYVREVTGILAGINELNARNEQFKIYPNPSSGSFVIRNIPGTSTAAGDSKQKLQLFDLSGKLELSQMVNENTQVNADNLAQGVYLVQLLSSSSVFNSRLVIIR